MNPIAFEIGPFTIFWYSLFVLAGFLAGYFLAYREFKRLKLSLDFLSDYFFYVVPIAIIGARIHYVIFRWDVYSNDLGQILAIWNGGLAIHGGIIAAILFTIYYTRKHKVSTLKFMDIAAPCLILGQAIGRWGNFFNQEAFGVAVEADFLRSVFIPEFIINGMRIDGVYYHPTFLYESLLCLLGLGLIMLIRKIKSIKVGEQTALYFVIYGISRLFVESIRTDSLMLGNFRVAQIISVIMILIGLALFIRQRIYSQELYNEIPQDNKKDKKKKKGGRK